MATYGEVRAALNGPLPSSEQAAWDFRQTLLLTMEKKEDSATVVPAEYLLMEALTSLDLEKEREHVRRLYGGRNRAAGLDKGTYRIMVVLLRTLLPDEFNKELLEEEAYCRKQAKKAVVL